MPEKSTSAPLDIMIEPEIWEPRGAVPPDAVHMTVTDCPALIVAKVDLAV